MSIRYLKHREIDFEKWDNCIDNANNGIIYSYSWYLNITAHYWDALVKDEYESVMPLPCRKKAGINYIYQPAFVQQLGVFSRNYVDNNLLEEFIEAIPGKYKFVDYNLNTDNQLRPSNNYKIINNKTFELSLTEPYDDIRKNYSTNNKRNIKKAEKNNLSLTYVSKPETIIELFQNNRGKQLGTITCKEYNNLKHIAYICLHKGIGHIHSVYTETNTLCAGMILVKSHKRIIFLFSGSNDKARETGAMSLLIDDFIKKNDQTPYIFDFEGSNHSGTANFYKGFGSRQLIYQKLIINRLPWLLKFIFKLYQKGKSLFLHKNLKSCAR